jgi:hypothetical protein
MGSLSDQLLKAGLASKSKAQKLNSEQRRKKKQQHKDLPVDDPLQVLAQQAVAERKERDRALNRRQQELRLEKEARARSKQIIEQHCLKDVAGEVEFNFAVAGKVKKLYINQRAHQGLVRGSLSICMRDGDFVLIPTAIAAKLHDPDNLLVIKLSTSVQDETAGGDDPYADYQIPDDLMW